MRRALSRALAAQPRSLHISASAWAKAPAAGGKKGGPKRGTGEDCAGRRLRFCSRSCLAQRTPSWARWTPPPPRV